MQHFLAAELLVLRHWIFMSYILSWVMRKQAFCICENKDADQLCGNRTADQRLCFRYIVSIIPLHPKAEISSLWPSSVIVQPGLCLTWSETPKTGFLATQLFCLLWKMWSLEEGLGANCQNDGTLYTKFCYKCISNILFSFKTALHLSLFYAPYFEKV